jgi:hypothetical protein
MPYSACQTGQAVSYWFQGPMHQGLPLITGIRVLSLVIKPGPDALFHMLDRANCVLLVSMTHAPTHALFSRCPVPWD